MIHEGVDVSFDQVVPKEVTLHIAGKSYKAREVTLRHLGLLQRRVRRNMTQTWMECNEGLRRSNPEKFQHVCRPVAMGELGPQEVQAEVQSSPDMLAYVLSLVIYEPRVSEADFLDMPVSVFMACADQIGQVFPDTPREDEEEHPTAEALTG